MQIIKDYRDNKELRDSFHELAGKVFGLNFEDWYQNGFWKDNYNPHSIVINGKVVANVSVNQCNMLYQGKPFKLIQLGTVMTDPDYRGRGFARRLLEEVIKEYEDKVDGIYLFANDSVLDFYPKFGFVKKDEFQYSRKIINSGSRVAEHFSMEEPKDWEKMVKIMETKPQCGNMTMVDNPGLYMFYLSQFMRDSVYMIPDKDTYVVAEMEDDTLVLHAIWGEASIDEVVASFGHEINQVILQFTPADVENYDELLVDEADTTFFVRGRAFEILGDYKFKLQEITHA